MSNKARKRLLAAKLAKSALFVNLASYEINEMIAYEEDSIYNQILDETINLLDTLEHTLNNMSKTVILGNLSETKAQATSCTVPALNQEIKTFIERIISVKRQRRL